VRIAALVALVLLPLGVVQAVAPQQSHPYRRHWKKSIVGKGALARVGVGTAVGQVRKSPRRYGGGVSGFGKRAGAGFATHAVKTTVEHLVAAPLHEDLHYHRSNARGVGPRLRHALVSTVVTRNTKSGSRTPALGRISGHAAAGAFSQGVLHAGAGASTAGIGLGAEAGANVAREFWPRKHKSRRKVRSRS